VDAAIFRHPRRDRFHGHHPIRYPHGHYYWDYPVVDYRPFRHRYRHYDPYRYYGYSYSCVYYPEPVVYRLHSPSVVYVERDPVYVEVERAPETIIIQPEPEPEMGPPAPASGSGSLFFPEGEAQGQEQEVAAPYEPLDEAPHTVVQKGTAAFMSGDYEAARRFFIEAVMADERDGYAKLLYAFALFAEGDHALSALTVRRALLTSDVLVYQPPDLRTLYPEPEAFREHLSALIVHLEHQPKDHGARFLLGYVYYATGRPEEASEAFHKVSQANEDDELASRLYATASAVEKVEP